MKKSVSEHSSYIDFMPHLDAVRAIAIMGVICSHWLSAANENSRFEKFITFGGNGVFLFFTLSGFLITALLLKGKRKAEESKSGKTRLILPFLARRFLRIFPLYYFFIFALLILVPAVFQGKFLWYFFYASNVHYWMTNSWASPLLNHTWALAVEVQFYLLWPWLILGVPKKYELRLILAFIFFAPLFKYILIRKGLGALLVNALTPSNFDFFGMGALLAWYKTNQRPNAFVEKWLRFDSPWTLVFLSAAGYCYYYKVSFLFYISFSLFAFFFIHKASRGFEGSLKGLLGNGFILYAGKISYGLYLYHKIVPWVCALLSRKLNFPMPDNPWIQFPIFFTICFAVAHFSWVLLEKPCNGLKKHFQYDEDPLPAPERSLP